MLLTCLIAISTVAPPPAVGDFFPLTPGIKRSYEYRQDDSVVAQDDEIVAATKFGGKEATPIVWHIRGQSARTLYRIDGDTVFVLSSGDKKLDEPVPLVRLGQPHAKWSYTQASPVSIKKGVLNVTAESNLVGKRSILGVQRDVLEVKTVGRSEKNDVVFEFHQTALFAAGVGLVEMTTEQTVIRTTQKSKLTLVQFTAPKPNQ